MIDIQDLHVSLGAQPVLDGASLTVEPGEFVGLVGPNGAGKTTLVRALTGTTDADGEVTVFGDAPQHVDRQRIGVLPQSFSPHARLSARELLDYYAGLYDDPRPVDAVLDDVGMTEAADTWYENLSGGQQRRICVGATLVNDPDLLVLDEPTTGIDPAGRRALWDLLEGLADGGVTILLTTHSMQEASRLADRVGLLADGRLVACDAPAQLIAEYGGEPRLVITGSFDPSVTATLSAPAEVADGTLTVHDVEPTEIGSVVAQLEDTGVTYDGISWSEPDLDDVYMALAEESERAETAHAEGADSIGGERRERIEGGDGL